MEENIQSPKHTKQKIKHPVVVIERNWKEYLGECVLIVFSVLLALGLSEYFNNVHEKKHDNEILHQLREELMSNKNDAALQYDYYRLQVFVNIDSATKNPAFAKKFLDSGQIHLSIIMPQGALLKDLNDVAWQQARQSDVLSRIDFDTYSLLTEVYNNQARFLNLEPSLEKILISYDSRKPENLNVTLTLIHDILYGWIYARTPTLLEKYQKAIDKLSAF